MGKSRTPGLAKLPQTNVEKTLSWLPAEPRDEFLAWCWFNPSYADIKLRLEEMIRLYENQRPPDAPLTVTASNISHWYTNNYPIGDQAKVLNALTRSYHGLDTMGLMEQGLGQLAYVIAQIFGRIQDESLLEIPLQDLVQMLPGFFREFRSMTEQLHRMKIIKTKQELEMAGAQRALDIVLNIYKDDPLENQIKEATTAAMLQIEAEVVGE
jgi:hypothetical protein